MRYFVDCEFDGHAGPLLSIALVREDGASIHVRTLEAAKDPWVIQNVETVMDAHWGQGATNALCELNQVGANLRLFIDEDNAPEFVADSPVDIGRLCRALTTSKNGGWQSCGYSSMSFRVENVDCYPTALVGAVQHNAWWDAMALRAKMQ